MKGEKMAVVTIGYRDYAMSMKDATTLLAIAQRAVGVTYDDAVRGRFRRLCEAEGDSDPTAQFASRMEIAEVAAAPKRIPESHRIAYEQKRLTAPKGD